ncbi:MAG TPA: ECF-type sigma factor [Phycisphaerae bacterium]|nr:ECF-type sigma factor [Phycisphaerae bacterium]
MSLKNQSQIEQVLTEYHTADQSVIAAKLLPLVYDELRSLAAKYLRRERRGHTLDPTALVHEAYLRLFEKTRVTPKDKTHLYALCAEAMRRVLTDHARARRRTKRGGDFRRVAFDQTVSELAVAEVDLIDFNDALERLSALDKRQARIVELRLFAGLTVEEVASVLAVSKRTVEGDWKHAKAWMRAELSSDTMQ